MHTHTHTLERVRVNERKYVHYMLWWMPVCQLQSQLKSNTVHRSANRYTVWFTLMFNFHCACCLYTAHACRGNRGNRETAWPRTAKCAGHQLTHNTSRTTRLCTPTLPMFYTIGLEHIGQMAVISEYRHLSPTPYTWAHCTIHILAHWAYLYIHTIGEPNRTNCIMFQGRRGRAAGDLIGFWEAI